MKKDVQRFINQTCEEKIKEYNDYIEKHSPLAVERLRSCSAEVTYYESFAVLRSYNTNVAVFDFETYTLYDVLRLVYGYTATSAQHISKFRNDMRFQCRLGWNDITELRWYYVA